MSAYTTLTMNVKVELLSDCSFQYIPQSQAFGDWKVTYKKSINSGATIGDIEVRGKAFFILFLVIITDMIFQILLTTCDLLKI